MSLEEILQAEQSFVDAAARAKAAGFDAVTLHAAHDYLLAQFLSPLYNKRTDQYGGTLENRARMLIETIALCKKRLGSAVPVIVRISADEYVKGGRTIEESVELAKLLEQAGADAIDVTGCVPTGKEQTE